VLLVRRALLLAGCPGHLDDGINLAGTPAREQQNRAPSLVPDVDGEAHADRVGPQTRGEQRRRGGRPVPYGNGEGLGAEEPEDQTTQAAATTAPGPSRRRESTAVGRGHHHVRSQPTHLVCDDGVTRTAMLTEAVAAAGQEGVWAPSAWWRLFRATQDRFGRVRSCSTDPPALQSTTPTLGVVGDRRGPGQGGQQKHCIS
jgi:hypothetical protein